MIETPTQANTLIRAQLIQALRLASRQGDALLALAAYAGTHSRTETVGYLASQQGYLLNLQAELAGLCKQVGESSDAVQRRLLEILGLPITEEAGSRREEEEGEA